MAEMTKELNNILKATYDSEADALLVHIKKLTQSKESFKNMVDEEKGAFNTILQEQKEKNVQRTKQINDRIAELKNKI